MPGSTSRRSKRSQCEYISPKARMDVSFGALRTHFESNRCESSPARDVSRRVKSSNNLLAQPEGEGIVICSLGLAGFLGGSNGLHVPPPIGIGDTGLRTHFFDECGASSANRRRDNAVQ